MIKCLNIFIEILTSTFCCCPLRVGPPFKQLACGSTFNDKMKQSTSGISNLIVHRHGSLFSAPSMKVFSAADGSR